MPTTPHTPGVHYRAKGVECTYTGKDGEAPLYACSSSASGSASYLSSSSSPSHRKDFDRKIRLLGYQRIEGRQVERLKEEQARNLGAGGEGGGRGRPSLASPPCVMIINRRLVKHRQLGASIVPSDAAEIAAHHALAVIIMFCVE
ncbi:n-terminal domain-containing protein, partial [Cystoisospora suis]